MISLIIRNAWIVDGSGNPGYRADLAVEEGRIAWIGHYPEAQAEQVLDAAGKVLCPGFIDVHTHSELAMLAGEHTAGVRMGVTTELIAPDGFCFAPLPAERLAEYRRIKNNETGWLTYLWHLRMDQVADVIREDLEDILEKLKARERFEEENDFYICKACGTIATFNQAMDVAFVCPSCDQPLEHFENEMLLKALKKRIEAIKETLGHA